MPAPVAPKLNSGDRVLYQIQANVEALFRKMFANIPMLQGRLLEDINVKKDGSTSVGHGLGRPMRGWFVVRSDANAVVWETAGKSVDTNINLTASELVTVSIWVF